MFHPQSMQKLVSIIVHAHQESLRGIYFRDLFAYIFCLEHLAEIFFVINLSCKIEMTVHFNILLISNILCNFILWSLNTMSWILYIITKYSLLWSVLNDFIFCCCTTIFKLIYPIVCEHYISNCCKHRGRCAMNCI